MDIIKAHAVKNRCYIVGTKMKPKGIVIHSTGANNPYLRRYVDCPKEVGRNKNNNHWNTSTPGGRYVCVHAFIGYDNTNRVRVAEILPLDICCWGVGRGYKGSYNDSPPYIQIEICEDFLEDYEYYRRAFDTAMEYCSHLCTEFGLSPDNIVGHNEAYLLGYGSNHSDPEHWMKRFGDDMSDFRTGVREMLNVHNESNEELPYIIKVTSPELNIRKDAGTDSLIVGRIIDQGCYTITQTQKGNGASLWGKLKSGAGWISLDYTKKL